MKNYKEAIDFLTKMFELYEKAYGFESEKSAKIFMELGQIYELSENMNDAIEYYKSSYTIWEKTITDGNYELLFTLAIKISELYEKLQKIQEAFEILKVTETKYSNKLDSKYNKKMISFKKLLINYASSIQDLDVYLEELIGLEVYINKIENVTRS
jgi:tetratricopeptide (TPR) repeat protein